MPEMKYARAVLFLFLGASSAHSFSHVLTNEDSTPMDIIRRHGCIEVQDLLSANSLSDARRLPRVGATIEIPFVRPHDYTRIVQERDALTTTVGQLRRETEALKGSLGKSEGVITGLREEAELLKDERASLTQYRVLFFLTLVILVGLLIVGALFSVPFRRIITAHTKTLEERKALEAELARRKTQFQAELKRATAALGVDDEHLARVADLAEEISDLKLHEARNRLDAWFRNHRCSVPESAPVVSRLSVATTP